MNLALNLDTQNLRHALSGDAEAMLSALQRMSAADNGAQQVHGDDDIAVEAQLLPVERQRVDEAIQQLLDAGYVKHAGGWEYNFQLTEEGKRA